MTPLHIEGANLVLGPPPGWTEEQCSKLWVRVEEIDGVCRCTSAWEPTPAELACLLAGGRVVLSVAGGQPPVALSVERPRAHVEVDA